MIGENVNRSRAFSDFGAKIDMFAMKGKGNVSPLLIALANKFFLI